MFHVTASFLLCFIGAPIILAPGVDASCPHPSWPDDVYDEMTGFAPTCTTTNSAGGKDYYKVSGSRYWSKEHEDKRRVKLYCPPNSFIVSHWSNNPTNLIRDTSSRGSKFLTKIVRENDPQRLILPWGIEMYWDCKFGSQEYDRCTNSEMEVKIYCQEYTSEYLSSLSTDKFAVTHSDSDSKQVCNLGVSTGKVEAFVNKWDNGNGCNGEAIAAAYTTHTNKDYVNWQRTWFASRIYNEQVDPRTYLEDSGKVGAVWSAVERNSHGFGCRTSTVSLNADCRVKRHVRFVGMKCYINTYDYAKVEVITNLQRQEGYDMTTTNVITLVQERTNAGYSGYKSESRSNNCVTHPAAKFRLYNNLHIYRQATPGTKERVHVVNHEVMEFDHKRNEVCLQDDQGRDVAACFVGWSDDQNTDLVSRMGNPGGRSWCDGVMATSQQAVDPDAIDAMSGDDDNDGDDDDSDRESWIVGSVAIVVILLVMFAIIWCVWGKKRGGRGEDEAAKEEKAADEGQNEESTDGGKSGDVNSEDSGEKDNTIDV